MAKYYSGIETGTTLDSMLSGGSEFGIFPSQDIDCANKMPVEFILLVVSSIQMVELKIVLIAQDHQEKFYHQQEVV